MTRKPGRKGKAAAAMQDMTTSAFIAPRLKCPTTLTDAEALVWRNTVNALPGGFIGPVQVPIMTAFCRCVVRSEVIARQIALFQSEWLKAPGGLERLDRLHSMADREHRGMLAAARALRITLTAQRSPEVAASAQRQSVEAEGVTPWDAV